MKKKFIFLTMMLLTFLGVNLNVLNAQEYVIVGDGTETSLYLPISGMNKTTLSQQIYTQTQLGFDAGSISKIAFKNRGAAITRTVDVYMSNIDKESFSAGNDWIQVSNDDLVFSGTWNIANEDWTEINLDKSFEYSGSNILISIHDKTNSWGSSAEFYRNGSENFGNTAIRFSSDVSSYATDITKFYAKTGELITSNQIKFTLEVQSEPLSSPENLSVTDVTYNSATFSWSAVEGAEYYYVYNGDNICGFAQAGTETTVTCEVGGLTPNTTYSDTFKVSAYKGAETAISEYFPEFTTLEVPAVLTPTGFSVVEEETTYNSITLTWDASPNAEKYIVYYGTESIDAWGTSTTIDGLVPETNYCFSVASYIAGNTSEPSDEICYSTLAVPVPATPQNLTASELTPTSLVLSWDEAENAEYYKIYKNDQEIAIATSYATSYFVEDLLPETAYYFAVSAINYTVESEKSASVTITTPALPETRDVVFILHDTYGDGWNGGKLSIKVNGVDYETLMNEDIDGVSNSYSGGETQTYTRTFNIGDEITVIYTAGSYPGENEYYVNYDQEDGVEIFSGSGSDGSKTFDFVVSKPGPENLTAEKTDIFVGDELKLSWDELMDAVSYNVYVDGSMVVTVTETSCTLDDLARNIDGYSIAVSANIGEGTETTETSKSNVIKVYVAGYTNLTVNVADTKDEVIEDATITYSGKDVFENEISGNIADGNIRLKEGTYTIAVSKDGYVSSTEEVELLYNVPLTLDVILFKEGVFEVVAEFATNEWEQEVVKVEWTDSYEKYNVYRKNAMTGVEKKLTYSPTEENSYEDYETLYGGQYQYGVSWFTQQVGAGTITENFSSDFPEGWTGVNYQMYNGYIVNNARNMSVYTKQYTFVEGATLTFDFLNTSNLKVYSSTSTDGDNLTELATMGTNSSFETSEAISLPAGTYYLVFNSTGINYTIGVDNVILTNVNGVSIEVETEITWSPVLVKEGDNAFVGGTEGSEKAWHVATNWSKAEVPGNGEDVVVVAEAEITTNVNVNKLTINNNVTIKSGGTLTITGTSHNNSIYLEAGGQLVQNKEGVSGIFIIDVNEEWQFISLPIHNNYSYNTYTQCGLDLFKYDGNADLEWVNYMNEENWTESNFLSGVGYLVADGDYDTPHKFYGTFNAETTFSKELTYSAEKHLANFHLLGNPFTFDMKYDEIGFNNLAEGFAVVGDDGSYVYRMDNVKVGEGFFVKAKAENPSFTYGARSAKEKSAHINLIATGTAGEDNVIINFAGASEGFEKLDNFNKEIANIYVQDNAKRYGIYNVNDDVQEVIVKFDAKQMGQYTINAVTEGEFDMVTLVDRMTGVETDLLVEGYTFTATSNDNTDRFIVKFADKKQSEVSSSFVYQSGEELIINAEGTVQIIDVMGRMVYSNDVTNDNNRISVSELNNAAYIVRLINAEGVKVQKVVIY